MAYEIGPVYLWQNQVGEWAHLNGTECRVLGRPQQYCCVLTRTGQRVDTPALDDSGWATYAEPGDLRRRDPPPSGERLILDRFKEREHA